MNRRNADRLVGALITVVLVVGGVLTWQAYQQNRAMVLRERYARGELSDDEFERRRKQLKRVG